MVFLDVEPWEFHRNSKNIDTFVSFRSPIVSPERSEQTSQPPTTITTTNVGNLSMVYHDSGKHVFGWDACCSGDVVRISHFAIAERAGCSIVNRE